jgi:hypothetical protein
MTGNTYAKLPGSKLFHYRQFRNTKFFSFCNEKYILTGTVNPGAEYHHFDAIGMHQQCITTNNLQNMDASRCNKAIY